MDHLAAERRAHMLHSSLDGTILVVAVSPTELMFHALVKAMLVELMIIVDAFTIRHDKCRFPWCMLVVELRLQLHLFGEGFSLRVQESNVGFPGIVIQIQLENQVAGFSESQVHVQPVVDPGGSVAFLFRESCHS